jgi:lipid-A-disaccharide synthase-like uncharacterized protein
VRPAAVILLALTLLVLIGGLLLLFGPGGHAPEGDVTIKVSLDDVAGPLAVERRGESFIYIGEGPDGERLELTPDEFTRQLHESSARRPWWGRVFNISTPLGIAWVTIGLIGQFMFTGRMLVQWITSERARRSVVPTMFWWMSLAGATMLLAYFVWRRDMVGILGQSTGWLIYTRNLWLIYSRRAATVADATATGLADGPTPGTHPA